MHPRSPGESDIRANDTPVANDTLAKVHRVDLVAVGTQATKLIDRDSVSNTRHYRLKQAHTINVGVLAHNFEKKTFVGPSCPSTGFRDDGSVFRR